MFRWFEMDGMKANPVKCYNRKCRICCHINGYKKERKDRKTIFC